MLAEALRFILDPGKPQGPRFKTLGRLRDLRQNGYRNVDHACQYGKQYKYYIEIQKYRNVGKPCKYRNTETFGNLANTIYDGRGPAGPMFQFVYDRKRNMTRHDLMWNTQLNTNI